MIVEPLPIELYVSQRFNEKTFLSIIEEWRVESEVLEKIVVAYFREMGIYSVTPGMESKTRESIAFFLKNSPEIFTIVRKAQQQEALRRQTKRADNSR